MQKGSTKKKVRPPQHQRRPGSEHKMIPQPVFDLPEIKGSGKLKNKVAFITGGDSGIGKAVAVLFAKEGASVSIAFLNEDKDAKETQQYIKENYGTSCMLIKGDLSKENNCIRAIQKTIKQFGRIDIVVNNAALHFENKSIETLTSKELIKTFETNIFSYFWVTKAAIPYLKKGSSIINTSSVTAYRGSGSLIDYASTKGAIVSFTRSLSSNLAKKGIRVNGVAPGPIWTPLIPASFNSSKTAKHGSDVPMQRAGEPAEVAPSFLFLASSDASYMTGQFLHPNGGEIING